ncbi:ROK family transcriptional regulator [Gramella jeungdoensis]|uniref:ROK family transcriptional regulator n=1 Tax=Gramella jeungdoensis TaxID=708091 RepID=A0ABT0Z614_9FLAO|nr:ROK family transcriptional regulator [Gramella jeungdoensis]MCM8570853.1 ROK family transcriptional regulator [Gramella jeungdoensis]
MGKSSYNFFTNEGSLRTLSTQERKINLQRLLLFKHLFSQGQANCGELSDALNISYPNALNLLQRLTKEGFIKSNEQKRNKIFSINENNELLTLTIQVGIKKSYATLNDQFYDKKEEKSIDNIVSPIKDLGQGLQAIYGSIIKTLKLAQKDIIGVSFILPPFSEFRGNFPTPEALQDLESELQSYSKKFISIINYSNAIQRATYEKYKLKLNNSLIITINNEVGLAIVSNGRMNNREHFPGSEFGHFPIKNNGTLCSCGKKDCLETQISYFAIIKQINHELSKGVKSLIEPDNHCIQNIIDKALAGDQLAIDTIYKAGNILGKAISILVQLIDPSEVLIVSELSRSSNVFSNGIFSGLNLYCPLKKTNQLKIIFEKNNSDKLVLGSFYTIWDKIFRKKQSELQISA